MSSYARLKDKLARRKQEQKSIRLGVGVVHLVELLARV